MTVGMGDMVSGYFMLTEMDCFGVTDVGRMRSKNQDHYLIADLNKSLRIAAVTFCEAIGWSKLPSTTRWPTF